MSEGSKNPFKTTWHIGRDEATQVSVTLYGDGRIEGDPAAFRRAVDTHLDGASRYEGEGIVNTLLWLLGRELERQRTRNHVDIANVMVLLLHMVGVVADGGTPDPTDIANCKELLERIKYPKEVT